MICVKILLGGRDQDERKCCLTCYLCQHSLHSDYFKSSSLLVSTMPTMGTSSGQVPLLSEHILHFTYNLSQVPVMLLVSTMSMVAPPVARPLHLVSTFSTTSPLLSPLTHSTKPITCFRWNFLHPIPDMAFCFCSK